MVKNKQKILWPSVDPGEWFCELKMNLLCFWLDYPIEVN